MHGITEKVVDRILNNFASPLVKMFKAMLI